LSEGQQFVTIPAYRRKTALSAAKPFAHCAPGKKSRLLESPLPLCVITPCTVDESKRLDRKLLFHGRLALRNSGNLLHCRAQNAIRFPVLRAPAPCSGTERIAIQAANHESAPRHVRSCQRTATITRTLKKNFPDAAKDSERNGQVKDEGYEALQEAVDSDET
jgi:hypothetical protein